jgi:uncharacterized protein
MTGMNDKRTDRSVTDVSMRAIRRYARRVAEQFRPERIILFGSYAYGDPNADSDVDLLVVMPARNQLDQAARIRLKLPAPFAMDLIVRTPRRMQQRLDWGDSFITEIVSKGRILYEAKHEGVGEKSRSRPHHRPKQQSQENASS